MRYHSRRLEEAILSASKYFKIVLLLGARQTGKSTLLKHLLPHAKRVVFDPIQDLYDVRKDPDQFLNLFPSPLILDEVQFAPELLSSLKRKVDQSEIMGSYFLTGSQNFSMLKSISESLAGRVVIFHLDPFSPLEWVEQGTRETWVLEYLKDPEGFIRTSRSNMEGLPPLNEFLFRGGYPRATSLPLKELEAFFLSYIQTYVERDVRLLENIEQLSLFGDFLRLSAHLTGQEVNASQLGRELGLTSQTARKWLNLLTYSYQWIEVGPYHGNAIKRLSDKKKGYFKDTGLACHLMRIHSPESLVTSLKMGSIFETWAINFLLQHSTSANCYHWRSHGGGEIDLVLERDGTLYPIEIKAKSHPNKGDTHGLKAFRATYSSAKIAPGLVIHGGEETYLIDEQTLAISWKSL